MKADRSWEKTLVQPTDVWAGTQSSTSDCTVLVAKACRPVRPVLVGGLEHVLFFHILGIVIPIDELIVFRG